MTYRALKAFEQDYLPPVLWSIVVDYAVTLLDEDQYRKLNLLEINGIDIIEHALSLRLCSYCTTNDPIGDDQTRKNHLKHAIAEFRYATFRQYRFRRLEPLAKAQYTRMIRAMRMEPYINDLGLLSFNLETQIFLLLLWTLGF